MSLRQQFSLLTAALVIILLSGSLLLNLNNARNAFEQQLNARAYDAASALSISMSHVNADDHTQLLRLIDALYDRGFFSEITLTLVDGTQLHKRSTNVQNSVTSPRWFQRLLPIALITAEADVMDGWQRLGDIQVTSYTGTAYQDLWTVFLSEIKWYGLILLLGLVFLQWLLRWLLKPLQEVERQALAISNRQLIVQKHIPRTRELKHMVLAMNHMVQKLRSVFTEQVNITEQLKAESFHDTLTGVLNRRGFDQRLESVLQSQEEHSGVLLLLQLQELAEYNQLKGRQAADDLIQHLGRQLSLWIQSHVGAFAGRRSGSDFAIYAPCLGKHQAQSMAQQLLDQLTTTVLSPKLKMPCHLGGVYLHSKEDMPSQALSQADAALRQAQQQTVNNARLYEDATGLAELTASEWREFLLQVLHEESLELLFQPVVNLKEKRLVQVEVFSQVTRDDQVLKASRFWPMVEQHHLSTQFDALIIRQVLALLSKQPLPAGVTCCINVSPATLTDETFIQKLQQWLSSSPLAAAQIALEVPESFLSNIEASLLRTAEVVHPFGVKIGVDQIGTGGQAFSYLQRLPLDYLRIDGSFGRGVAQAQDQRFFVHSMAQIAKGIELPIWAEGVEQEEDIAVLQQLGIQALSGYFISRPQHDFKSLLLAYS